ncbi:MAG: TonB-dependent receptor [Pseudomonadota bacterium]
MGSRYISTLALCAAFGAPDFALAQSGEELVGEDIIVKGDKVQRSLSDATAGTTIIPGDEAERPINNDIDDALRDQPNVLANEGFSLPSIRGVDSTSGARPGITVGSQPRTPILVDDVATPAGDSSTISQITLWDVDSIEVARGPQPTSTGRNAFGGAIRIYTNDPSFNLEAAARASYFTEGGTLNGAFMLNVPVLEDELAVRITGEGSIGQSYVDIEPVLPAGFDPEDEIFNRLRGKLLWEPDALSGLSVLLTIDRSRSEKVLEGFASDVDSISIQSPGLFSLTSSYEEVDQVTAQAKVTYDFNDNFSLVTRFAFQENELLFVDTGESFFGFSLGATGFDKRQFEGEAYLQFQDLGFVDRGVFGVIHNTENEEGFNDGFIAFTLDGKIQNTGIYGEVELSADEFVPGLTFIAGGRLEIDQRQRTTNAGGVQTSNADLDETVFLPKAGVRYDFDEDTRIGYTYSRGFRNGGVDVDFLTPGIPTSNIDPEFIDQNEIFARTSLFGDMLDVSATAFYYNWDDAQIPGVVQPGGLFGNVPEAIGFGGELSVSFQPIEEVRLDGALGLLKTEITDAGTATHFDGQELPRAPNVTASGGITVTPFDGFEAKASVSYVDSTRSALGEATLDAYTLVDLSASYEFEPGPTSVQVEGFISNLLDERYVTFDEQIFGFGGGNLRAVGRPRTFGGAVTVKF